MFNRVLKPSQAAGTENLRSLFEGSRKAHICRGPWRIGPSFAGLIMETPFLRPVD
jgi:hypothetical protein